jgi:hypothetical protein
MRTPDIQKMVNDMTTNLKNKWSFYRHAAYLKNQGWTEEQYQDYKDPDRNQRASRIKDYYHGYAHIVAFESSQGDPWSRYPTWIQAYTAIETWCKENCEDKWRTDIHRVIKDYWGNWELNDIAGGDVLFFAFKNDNDAFMFKLKWGGG